MSMINIDELNSNIDNKNKIKTDIYEEILKKCHNRIKLTAELNNIGYCFYTIPKYMYGVPLYNHQDCTMYIVEALSKNGFELKYTHPNLLYISWAGKSNPKEYKKIEKKNPELKPIEDYKINENLIYNKNLLTSLDDKIKFLKNS